MEQPTKKELQLSIVNQIDDLFTATDWDTFKNKLQHITEQASMLDWDNRMRDFVLPRIHRSELRLLTDMSYKYLYGEKVATKKRTRDLKSDLAGSIHYSTLPGKALEDYEFNSLIRYK